MTTIEKTAYPVQTLTLATPVADELMDAPAVDAADEVLAEQVEQAYEGIGVSAEYAATRMLANRILAKYGSADNWYPPEGTMDHLLKDGVNTNMVMMDNGRNARIKHLRYDYRAGLVDIHALLSCIEGYQLRRIVEMLVTAPLTNDYDYGIHDAANVEIHRWLLDTPAGHGFAKAARHQLRAWMAIYRLRNSDDENERAEGARLMWSYKPRWIDPRKTRPYVRMIGVMPEHLGGPPRR